MNYTYMLRCCDGSLYTGWTNNLEQRLKTHRAGKGGHYTHSHRPLELAYFECLETKEQAMRREYHIKQLPRAEKEKLIAELSEESLARIRELNSRII